MSERIVPNDLEDKMGSYLRNKWTEVIDGKEDGNLNFYRELQSHGGISYLFKGTKTMGSQYGFFLVWDPRVFDNEVVEGDPEEVGKAKSALAKEGGWAAIKDGIVRRRINGPDDNPVWEEKSVLVVIRRRGYDPKTGSRTSGTSQDYRSTPYSSG